jgi:hypothetical protein
VLALRDTVTGLGGRELFEEFLLVQVALARRRRDPSMQRSINSTA